MTSLFPGQSSAQSHLGGTGPIGAQLIPPPPSFADFRFTTIGQEPELLKRISAPQPDFQYNEDRTSPTPSFRYPSQTPEPSRPRPSLLQALTNLNDHVDTDMSDAADEMAIDSPSVQQTVKETKANQPPLTNPAIPQGPRGWSEKPNSSITKPVPTRPHSSAPLATSGQLTTSPLFQEISRVFSNTRATVHHANPEPNVDVPPSAPAPTHNSDTNESACPPRQPLPSRRSTQESQYTSLRALQARLMSSLSNLSVPDTSNALLLVQAANTHSANALSTAHRSHTLAQQALASAREAVSAAQECLSAAEKAKAHASDAVTAVEQVGARGARGPNSEWEWRTIISGLQNDLQALGEWVGEREGEEATKRREKERIEKARRDKDSVDSAMQMVGGGLPPQVVQAMTDEVVKRVAEEEARSRSKPVRAVEAFSQTIQQQELHRAAELEADDARRAWSLEHRHPSKLKSTIPAEEGLRPQTPADEAREEERRRALDSAALLIKQAEVKEELRKREEEAHLQLEQREAEIKAQRLRELELRKLEVAKFHMLERERQAQQEAERKAADDFRARREAEQRKLKEAEVAEAKRVAEAKKQRAHLEEQAKRAAAQAAALKAEIIAREEEAKAAAQAAAKKREEEARAAEARAAEARMAEARAVEAKVAEARAAEAKAAEERAAVRAAEAREIELREAQNRKRQEVMAQKQRASAETAARILAERAREKELNDNSTPPVDPPRSPETPISITHPLPSPVFQTTALPPTQAASPHETTKSKGRAISGGVKLGTPEERAENSVPPSPSLTRSMALGLCSKKEGRPIPLPLPVPRPKVNRDKKEGSTPSQAESVPVTPPMRSSELLDSKFQPNPTWAAENPSVHRSSRDPGNLPIVPRSQLPPTSPEAQAANLRFVRDRNGVSRDKYLKRDPSAVSVKLEPLTDVKLLSPSSGPMKRKVTEQAGPALPKRPKVGQGGTPKKLNKGSQSPVVPPTPILASPPAVASPYISTSITNSANDDPNIPLPNTTSTAPQVVTTQSALLSKTVADSLTTTAPIPPRLKPNLPNFRIRKPSGSSVESPSTSHNAPMLPKSNANYQTSAAPRVLPTEPRALPGRGRSHVVTNATTSAPTPAPPRSNAQIYPEPSVEPTPYRATNPDTYCVPTPGPHRATTPTPRRTATPNLHRDNTSALSSYRPTAYQEIAPSPYDDGTQIAPAIHGDGGWDAPAEGDEESYSNSFRAREAPPRQYTSRGGDHYSPPARTPPRSLSPPLRRPAPNPQEIRRVSNAGYVSIPSRRPALHITTAPPAPRARTPPPPMQSPRLGKRRRWVEDEPTSHRYWQGDPEHGRTDQSFRPRSAHTPPPTRLNQRSLTPERFGGLQSRIGVRDAEVYNVKGQSYRPSYPSDSYYSSQPRRVSDSYQPTEFAGYEQDLGSSRVSLPEYDQYMPLGRHEVAERPDLLERMSAGAPTRGRGTGPTRGFNRGRGARGGTRPLEQRISSNNKNPMTLMNRLEA